jgi:hypothetical protein
MTSGHSNTDIAVPYQVDPEATVAGLAARLGVSFTAGGVHPAWRTRNALLPLGARTYPEIIGPDPAISHSVPPTLFGIDDLSAARLVTWAAKGANLQQLAIEMRAREKDFGAVLQGSRLNASGANISWLLTEPFADRAGGVLPLLV